MIQVISLLISTHKEISSDKAEEQKVAHNTCQVVLIAIDMLDSYTTIIASQNHETWT
jgi:hypothetical protein